MKRILSSLYTVLISVLITSLAFAGGIPGAMPNMPPMAPQEDPGSVLVWDASRNPTLDFVSRTRWSQTYAWTNRTRITAANIQETVGANTVVIDHVGTSLTPAMRMEPEAANILLEVVTDWTKSAGTTVTKDAVSWDGTANGAWTIVAGGADATVVSTAVAGTSAAFTFVAAVKRSVGTGAVSMTIDNGATWTAKTLTTSFQYFNVTKSAANPQLGFKLATSGDEIIVDCLMLVPNTALASSYFAPAAAIGDELVTDGGFAAAPAGAEINSGLFTVGLCYKITAHTDSDFTTVGAPDSNVGTYFNATATGGAGILDAGDKVKPITFTNWGVSGTWAPQALLGALTGKAQKVAGAGTAGYIRQTCTTVGKVDRFSGDITRTAGTGYFYTSAGIIAAFPITANGTYYYYYIVDSTVSGFYAVDDFAGTIDDLSIKEHGTVRISESNTITLAVPTAVASALAATGTLVVDWMPSYARAAGVAGTIINVTTATTASILLTTITAGNLSSYDGTTYAGNTAAYTANTWTKLAVQWPSSANKYKIGADVDGGGIVYGAEAAFDGAFTDGGTMTLGYTLHGPMWFKWIEISNRLLTPAQINALR